MLAVSTVHSLWVTADFVLRDKACLYAGGDIGHLVE